MVIFVIQAVTVTAHGQLRRHDSRAKNRRPVLDILVTRECALTSVAASSQTGPNQVTYIPLCSFLLTLVWLLHPIFHLLSLCFVNFIFGMDSRFSIVFGFVRTCTFVCECVQACELCTQRIRMWVCVEISAQVYVGDATGNVLHFDLRVGKVLRLLASDFEIIHAPVNLLELQRRIVWISTYRLSEKSDRHDHAVSYFSMPPSTMLFHCGSFVHVASSFRERDWTLQGKVCRVYSFSLCASLLTVPRLRQPGPPPPRTQSALPLASAQGLRQPCPYSAVYVITLLSTFVSGCACWYGASVIWLHLCLWHS